MLLSAPLCAGNRLWEWFSFGRYGLKGWNYHKGVFEGEQWPEAYGVCLGPTYRMGGGASQSLCMRPTGKAAGIAEGMMWGVCANHALSAQMGGRQSVMMQNQLPHQSS
jgi:hypothetical protein